MSTSSNDTHPVIQQCLNTDLSTDNALLNCVTKSLSLKDENLALALDFVFLLFSTALVFFMQAGFAMLCAGSVRRKNVKNSMLKNLLDACGAAIGFWTFGYAFAYSSNNGVTSFIGKEHFALQGLEQRGYGFWLFQFAFAATSATIVAGTLAERCQMIAYLCYSLVLTGFVYPIVVRAIWSEYGFLNFTNGILFGEHEKVGMIDFAGGGVVHVTGGVTALLATSILGPRKGRFHDNRGRKLETPTPFPGHSAALQVLGTFILWLGWYGFNCGSIIHISAASKTGGSKALISSLAAVNTTLAASGACVSALFTKLYRVELRTGEATFDLVTALNGTLAGLVSVTAGCAVLEPWAALCTGVIAGWIYLFVSNLLMKHCIDDAVDAIPVHFANGTWGVISVGLFAAPKHLMNLYGIDDNVGWFYEWSRGSANGKLLAAQIVGLLFITTWTVGFMSPFFVILNYLGWFRADSLEEVVGLDISYHGSEAFNKQDSELISPEYIEAYIQRKKHRKSGSSHSGHSVDRSANSWNYQTRNDNIPYESAVDIPSHEPVPPQHAAQHPVLSILREGRHNNAVRNQEESKIQYNHEDTEFRAIIGEDYIPTNIGIPSDYVATTTPVIPTHKPPSSPQHPVLSILKEQRQNLQANGHTHAMKSESHNFTSNEDEVEATDV